MREWRRTLASWPKETPIAMDPGSAPVWMREAEEIKRAHKVSCRIMSLGLALGVSAFFATFIVPMTLFLETGNPEWAIVFGVTGCLVAFAGLGRLIKSTASWSWDHRRIQALQTLEARGESTLGGEYVTVSYADRLWRHPEGGDWMDEGVLRFDMDRLTFVGRYTRFELPANAIVATEIRRLDGPLGSSTGRLYLVWNEGATSGTMSVLLPFRSSSRRRVENLVDLRERVDRWRREPFPRVSSRSAVLPPRVEPHQAPPWVFRAGLVAKLLAGGATLTLAIAAMLALVSAIHWIGLGTRVQMGGMMIASWMLWFLLWTSLSVKIDRRMPERWRYREPQAVPSASLGAVQTEDEEVRVRT